MYGMNVYASTLKRDCPRCRRAIFQRHKEHPSKSWRTHQFHFPARSLVYTKNSGTCCACFTGILCFVYPALDYCIRLHITSGAWRSRIAMDQSCSERISHHPAHPQAHLYSVVRLWFIFSLFDQSVLSSLPVAFALPPVVKDSIPNADAEVSRQNLLLSHCSCPASHQPVSHQGPNKVSILKGSLSIDGGLGSISRYLPASRKLYWLSYTLIIYMYIYMIWLLASNNLNLGVVRCGVAIHKIHYNSRIFREELIIPPSKKSFVSHLYVIHPKHCFNCL